MIDTAPEKSHVIDVARSLKNMPDERRGFAVLEFIRSGMLREFERRYGQEYPDHSMDVAIHAIDAAPKGGHVAATEALMDSDLLKLMVERDAARTGKRLLEIISCFGDDERVPLLKKFMGCALLQKQVEEDGANARELISKAFDMLPECKRIEVAKGFMASSLLKQLKKNDPYAAKELVIDMDAALSEQVREQVLVERVMGTGREYVARLSKLDPSIVIIGDPKIPLIGGIEGLAHDLHVMGEKRAEDREGLRVQFSRAVEKFGIGTPERRALRRASAMFDTGLSRKVGKAMAVLGL